MNALISLIIAFTVTASSALSGDVKPKYGPQATRLSKSNEYFRKNPAPDYWALAPYYVPQQDERSCSLASVTMILNGVRSAQELGSEDELATQKTVFAKVKSDIWNTGLGAGGRGVTLGQLGTVTLETLRSYGFHSAKVEVVHADSTPQFREKLTQALKQNEKAATDFILVNFIQGSFTGDTGGGHIAPIGAYDSAKKRALVMDPDRTWYEPYWVSEETLASGMNTVDKESGKTRGFVWVKAQ
jgi:hypothetical protein